MNSLLLAAAVLGILGSPAQEDEVRRDEPKNTSILRFHPDRDQLEIKAKTLAEQGRYAEALAIYDQAVRDHPNTVIPLDSARAFGVWEYVVGQIGSWPEEGREVYRRRVDPAARRLFEAAKSAGDAEALEGLIGQYPYSSVVEDALSLAANLWLDAGAPDRAADALARLLALKGDAPRPVTMARLGLAYARAGRRGRLEVLAERAAREHGAAVVRVGGRERNLAEVLRELAQGAPEGGPPPPPLTIPCWEMMGGHPSGSCLAEPRVGMSRLAWSAPVRLLQYFNEGVIGMPRGYAPVPSSEFRPYFPAVSDGILYVHNETTLYALNYFAQRQDVLWHFDVPLPGGEVMFEDRVIYATTVHEGRVFANLMTAVDRPDDQLGYVRVKYPFPRRALFALDAYTGRLLWKLGGETRSDALEENATFSAPPAAEEGRLYVGAVRQKLSTDPFEHFVLCIEAATGKILWFTFIASGGTEINLFGNSTRESLGTPVAVDEDSVYYGTNHGAVAALEKKTGRLRWIHRYIQIPVRPTRSIHVIKNRMGWMNSPPVAAQGLVVVTPMDAPSAYGLDARTGELRWARPRSMEIRTPYGLRGSTLVLGGEGLEFLDIRTGKILAMTGPELRGTGRGVVAEDGVYVPAADGLRRVSWEGVWEERVGKGWGSPGRLTGGNLLVVDGAVVLATPDMVEVYFDRRDQDRVIRDELQKDPDNPALLYRGALRLLQSGGAREAEKLLQRVVEGGGAGPARPEDERILRAARKRLCAVRLEAGRAAMEARDLDGAADLFNKARAAAPDLASRVEATLRLGRVLVARGDARRGIQEFQSLLPAGDEVAGGTRIFDLVRQEVDGVLKALGRGVYAPFEEGARRLMEAARREGTAEAYLEVCRSYPNSLAAEEALVEAASAHAKLGRTEEEVGVLRRFLRECPASPRVPEAYARLVLALERKGHRDSAASLLRRMARDFPGAGVTEEGGGRVTARAFAERRLRSEAYARPAGAAPRPALSPPLSRVFEHVERDHRMGVVLEAAGTPPSAAADLLFMNYGTTVKAFDLRRGAEAWQQPLRLPSLLQFAAFLDESLILAGERGICRVSAAEGKVEWRYVTPTPMRGFLLTGGVLCFLGTDSRSGALTTISALEAGRGTLAWSRSFLGTHRVSSDGSILREAGEAVAFITLEPYEIHLYERETGKRLLEKASFTPDLTAELEYASESLALVSSRGSFLEAYNLPTGVLRWRSDLRGISQREVQVVSGKVVIMGLRSMPGTIRNEMVMRVVDLENGKILRTNEKIDLGDARFMQVDGEMAYFASKEPDRTIAACAVRLGDLSVAWKTALGSPDATLFPLALAKDHVAVMTFESGGDGKFSYGGVLLDRSGRLVQNIRSGPVYERPPHAALANGRLVFSVDNRVEVYR